MIVGIDDHAEVAEEVLAAEYGFHSCFSVPLVESGFGEHAGEEHVMCDGVDRDPPGKNSPLLFPSPTPMAVISFTGW